MEQNTNLLQDSVELAMLTELKQKELITEGEFHKIKQVLMRDFHIVSDIATSVA